MFTSACFRLATQSLIDCRRMELIVFAILLAVACAQESQLKGPDNRMRIVGSNVALKCLSPYGNCIGIDWLKYVPGASPITVFKGPRTILNSTGIDKDRYSVDNSSGCDLVIRNVQLTDAGRFICSAIINSNQVTKSAHLIILKNRLKCTTNASEYNTVEGDSVGMTCELTNTVANKAAISWIGSRNAPADVPSGSTISLSRIVAASPSIVPPFYCIASVAVETKDLHGNEIEGLARNVPNASCNTLFVEVMYSVRNVTLSPSLPYYSPATIITCTANGRPLPTFKWQEMEDGSAWMDIQNQHGPEFTMTYISSKLYRCVATNVVRGISYNATSSESHNNSTESLSLVQWLGIFGSVVGFLVMILCFIFCCRLACQTCKPKDAQQSKLEGPHNTLSFVGSTVGLKCSPPSRNCDRIDWQKYVPGASPATIFKGPRTILNVTVIEKARYSVDNSSGCDLIIRNVQLPDAGRFICSAIINSSQVTKTANLIILASRSKCTTNASQDSTAEGDKVRMTCEVTYNDTNRASMIWNGSSNDPAAVQHGTNISRSFIVNASAPEVPSFTCVISFAFETAVNGKPIEGLATNIPVTSCETSVIEVMYSVRNVTLSPSLSHYPPESVIICTATGRPLPTCKWQEMENGTWTDIQHQNCCKFTMTSVSLKSYRCVAMNVIRGISYNATSNKFLLSQTKSATPIIYFAVCSAAGNLLLIILLVICCCSPGYRCCHTESKSHDETRHDQPLRENPDFCSDVNQVRDQESAYASLGAERDAAEYMSLEQKAEAKPKEEQPQGKKAVISSNVNQVQNVPMVSANNMSLLKHVVQVPESAYASLEANRGATEYMTLDQRKDAKPE